MGDLGIRSESLPWAGEPREGAGRPGAGAAHALTRTVHIDLLTVGGGPRFTGEDVAHVRRLQEVVDDLPPIVVHRGTMRVVDGVHRLRAARLAGRDTVQVIFHEGGEESAFVRAVEANVRHGLPLSVMERRAAAAKIMAFHPEWSDRRVAAVAGLSARTVADVRATGDGEARRETRLGRDGRARPLDAATGRRTAGRLLLERPGASLREVARIAGISPETVRDVRDRLARGEDVVPPGRRREAAEEPPCKLAEISTSPDRSVGRIIPDRPASSDQRLAVVKALRRDPSLRLSESGRLLLRWLEVSQEAAREWERILRAVPSHRGQQIAGLARSCAEDWDRLADEISSRTTTQSSA